MMQTHTQLYIKQFMHNFIQTKNHTSVLNLLNSSLQVLQHLVDSFIEDKQLQSSNTKFAINTHNQGSNCKNSLQMSLEEGFQRVYGKVKGVLDWADINIRDGSNSSNIMSSRSLYSHSDEELYQILNQYKSTNKTLKQNLQSSNQKLSQKQKQVLQLQSKLQKAGKQLKYLTSKISELEQENKNQEQYIEQLNQNVKNMEQCIQKLQLDLQNDKKGTEEREFVVDQLNKKINQLQNLIEMEKDKVIRERQQFQTQKTFIEEDLRKLRYEYEIKIEKKLEEVPQLIEKRLKQQKIWNAPIVDKLKKFMIYSQSINGQKQNTETLNKFTFLNSKK